MAGSPWRKKKVKASTPRADQAVATAEVKHENYLKIFSELQSSSPEDVFQVRHNLDQVETVERILELVERRKFAEKEIDRQRVEVKAERGTSRDYVAELRDRFEERAEDQARELRQAGSLAVEDFRSTHDAIQVLAGIMNSRFDDFKERLSHLEARMELEVEEKSEFRTPQRILTSEQYIAPTELPPREIPQRLVSPPDSDVGAKSRTLLERAVKTFVSRHGRRTLHGGADIVTRARRFKRNPRLPKAAARTGEAYSEIVVLKELSARRVFDWAYEISSWQRRHNVELPVPMISVISPMMTQVLESQARFLFDSPRDLPNTGLSDEEAEEVLRHRIDISAEGHFKARLRLICRPDFEIDLLTFLSAGQLFGDAAMIWFIRFKVTVARLCNGSMSFQFSPPLKKLDRWLVAVFCGFFDPGIDLLTWSAFVNRGSLITLEDFIGCFESAMVLLEVKSAAREETLAFWADNSSVPEEPDLLEQVSQSLLKDGDFLGSVFASQRKLFEPRKGVIDGSKELFVRRQVLFFEKCPERSLWHCPHEESEFEVDGDWCAPRLSAVVKSVLPRPNKLLHVTERSLPGALDSSRGEPEAEEDA